MHPWVMMISTIILVITDIISLSFSLREDFVGVFNQRSTSDTYSAVIYGAYHMSSV